MKSKHGVRKMSLRRTISAALPLFLIVASFVTPLAAAQAADSPSGATIASDKADYAPGELVTLTGTGWTGDTTVNIEVNDTLGKSWQHIVDVPVVDGNITDSFNLPDRFVSDYDVTAKGLVNGIATTTFTDAVSTDYQHWLDDDADWANTTLQQTNSSYKEGEVVPHVYDIKGGLSPSTSYSLRIFIDYKWDTKNICGFSGLGTYNADRPAANFDASSPTIDAAIPGGVGSGNFYTVNAHVTAVSTALQAAPSPKQRYVDVTFTTAAGIGDKTDVLLYWGLKLSLPNSDGSGCAGARAWPGASLQTNVGDGPTGVPIGGGSTLQINPNAIQADSDVTVSKTDSPDPVAQSADLTYTITGTNNGPGTATDVQIVDTLPAFTTFKSYQVTSPGFTNVTCSASSGVVTCKGSNSDPLTLIPGTPITIQVVVTVAANAPFAGTVKTGECQQNADRTSATAGVDLCNLVSISTTSIDTNPNNNSDSEPTDVTQVVNDALFKITKLVNGAPAGWAGGTFVMTYTCTKAGSTTLSADINVVYPTPGNATTSIPLGYSCSVVEKTKASPATDYSWTGESITGPVTITLGGANEITVTNTMSRDQASVQLKKDWGTGTVGETILKIGTGTSGAAVSDVATKDLTGASKGNGQTDAKNVDTGTYYFSEVSPGTGYTTTFDCTGAAASEAKVGGSDYVYSLAVAKGETVVCTFTNTRDQGSIKVIKDFVGAPADAKVNLQIDGATKKANALDNDTTGFIPVDTGNHSVGETQVAGTNLSDYTSSIVCKVGTTTVASGDGTSLGDIPVGKGDQVVCTITNTRITGSFKITKVLNVGGSGFNTNTLFTINYVCKIGTTTTASGSVQLKGGQSQTISGIPTGSVCTVTEPIQPAAPTGYTWWVTITGSPTAAISTGSTPEVTVTNSLRRTALTPGYWKNHLDVAFGLAGGSAVKLGNYPVSSKALATKVFNAMNCSSSKPNDAIGCLAGHLLATEYNLLNGTDTCIVAVRDKADAFLSGGVADGVTGITYTGPTGNYTLSAAQRAEAIKLKDAMDKYNNNGGC